ncbi:MAG: type I-C CRISPR-associated endonuclease Cas1c [Sumerlaeia bacterium]
MKRLLNTLFVNTDGAYLNLEGETVVVSVEQERKLALPLHTLEGIVCAGRVMASPFLLGAAADRNIAVSFLTRNGRFLARVTGPVHGNVLLRRAQHRASDSEEHAVPIARAFLTGKLANSRGVLLRAARENNPANPDSLRHAAKQLAFLIPKLEGAASLESLRAIEGEAARIYFDRFDHFISADKEHFTFKGRSRRPPLDNVNALLSFTYSLLAHDAASALETAGLDPAIGFLHQDRPGRPSLALDLLEELRAPLGDRFVLSLINRRVLSAKDFQTAETGAVRMTDNARRDYFSAWQTRKQETIAHPFLGETIAVGQIFAAQALLLARHLRGDLDAYPPFLWK